MLELLKDEAQSSGLDIEIEVATRREIATVRMRQRRFHLISLDMLMPSKDVNLEHREGLLLAHESTQTDALTSKLVVLSGLLTGNEPAAIEINAQLPKLDRYSKGEMDVAGDRGVEQLTQLGWAKRVLAYFTAPGRELALSGLQGPGRATSYFGCWLEQAQKHLPPALAGHAATLADTWDSHIDEVRRADAALRFVELTTRLALAQTQVLLKRKPHEAMGQTQTWKLAIDQLEQLLQHDRDALRRWTWSWHLARALPWLALARDVRNADRHSLAPSAGSLTWHQIKEPLRAAMDLASYWAQNPLWRRFSRTPDGAWLGERLAGNQFPRVRKRLFPPTGEFPALAAGGRGIWQIAIERSDGDPKPGDQVRSELIDWSDWLDASSAGRELWLPIYAEMNRRQPEWVWLDLDQGQVRSTPVTGPARPRGR